MATVSGVWLTYRVRVELECEWMATVSGVWLTYRVKS